ncbi:dihydrofolate reductase [Micrococcus luteus]|uniref:dihydrofolate reductase n=1 Tax=Micrococcus luteus TaxID=1270 RepID=UPI0010206D17|nr:dihydrofolate reductase [Micrococcus luteus]MCV7631485.1 dihydrofolate reductase [Micrococcus luteus]MCV7686992.1 dihydrofolate reductase [Micrococcus luteus]QGY90793.1 dihydrofolate reductase [Micrococcus luteus]RZB22743.1 dihydrofolate reductase [Micrococcus luteus]
MSRATRPTEPVIAMIWAQTPERVIGRDGTMPWHVPEDLAHFRAHTHGHPVIMGRRTWESFPARFRPLPGRTNIVVSRTLTATEEAGAELRAAGAVVVPDFGAALAAAAEADGCDTVWVIGGATLYEQALDVASRAEVTVIDADVDGDTHAPLLDARWRRTAVDPSPDAWLDSASGPRHRFERWERD